MVEPRVERVLGVVLSVEARESGDPWCVRVCAGRAVAQQRNGQRHAERQMPGAYRSGATQCSTLFGPDWMAQVGSLDIGIGLWNVAAPYCTGIGPTPEVATPAKVRLTSSAGAYRSGAMRCLSPFGPD